MGKPLLTGTLNGEVLKRVAAVLAGGQVAVLPTDTIYGLHCAVSHIDAIQRIVMMKGRPKGAGFILLASDIQMVDRYVASWPRGSRERLEGIWPAALTAILPASRVLPSIIAPRNKVAVRVPGYGALRSLIEEVGEALASTSVNRAGSRPLERIGCIRMSFQGLAAYVSRPGRTSRLPSTIVDFTVRPPVIERHGRCRWP
jgi:L-threonylcarbamoyladenylate synthase